MIYLAYDEPTLDEVLIYLAMDSQINGVRIAQLENILNISAEGLILNRLQNRHMRQLLANSTKRPQLNSSHVVNACANKISQICLLKSAGLTIPETTLPGTPDNEKIMEGYFKRIESKIGEIPWIIKPTASGRGRSVYPVYSVNDLIKYYREGSLIFINDISNYGGPIVQRLIDHPFDLRVVVSNDGEPKIIAILARVAENKERVAKNTALGSIPVGLEKLPEKFERDVLAFSSYLGGIHIIGIDIIPENNANHDEIYSLSSQLYPFWEELTKKRRPLKVIRPNQDVKEYIEEINSLYSEFEKNPYYSQLRGVINNFLETSTPVFIEVNDRPDFAYNTRCLCHADIASEYARLSKLS